MISYNSMPTHQEEEEGDEVEESENIRLFQHVLFMLQNICILLQHMTAQKRPIMPAVRAFTISRLFISKLHYTISVEGFIRPLLHTGIVRSTTCIYWDCT